MENYKNVYNVLKSYESMYQSAITQKERDRIESSVRSYAKDLPSEIYFELNEGYATGLFEYRHFQSDMERSLNVLSQIIEKNNQ